MWLCLSKDGAPTAGFGADEARPVRAGEWEQARLLAKALAEEGLHPAASPFQQQEQQQHPLPPLPPGIPKAFPSADSAASDGAATSDGTDDVSRVTNDLRRARAQLLLGGGGGARKEAHLGDSRSLSGGGCACCEEENPPSVGGRPTSPWTPETVEKLRELRRGGPGLREVMQEQRTQKKADLVELRMLQEKRLQGVVGRGRVSREGGEEAKSTLDSGEVDSPTSSEYFTAKSCFEEKGEVAALGEELEVMIIRLQSNCKILNLLSILLVGIEGLVLGWIVCCGVVWADVWVAVGVL